jgi:hypothetical protein
VFEIYCGAEQHNNDKSARSALAVIERLIRLAGLEKNKGMTLYTDNWYTTVALAVWFFVILGWFFNGTFSTSKKVSRWDDDVPFHTLSNGALATVERGWFCEAVIETVAAAGKKFWLQCTTWRDKKQVTFLHTSEVGASAGHFVKRRTKGKKGQCIFPAPKAQKEYSKYFNAVDRNDRDNSDYSTTIRTNRWYLRVFFWIFDHVVHVVFQSAIWCNKAGIGEEKWSEYRKKDGRLKFQVDLGNALITYALHQEWPKQEGPRPSWMRLQNFIPCDCGV